MNSKRKGNAGELEFLHLLEAQGLTVWRNDQRYTGGRDNPDVRLLAGGRAKVKKLYSPKTGKTYDGSIVLADTGGKYVNYRVELPKK